MLWLQGAQEASARVSKDSAIWLLTRFACYER